MRYVVVICISVEPYHALLSKLEVALHKSLYKVYPRGDAGVLSREYVLRIPSVS